MEYKLEFAFDIFWLLKVKNCVSSVLLQQKKKIRKFAYFHSVFEEKAITAAQLITQLTKLSGALLKSMPKEKSLTANGVIVPKNL